MTAPSPTLSGRAAVEQVLRVMQENYTAAGKLSGLAAGETLTEKMALMTLSCRRIDRSVKPVSDPCPTPDRDREKICA